MSRTDAHLGYTTLIREVGVEVHDHRTGPCDLLPVEGWLRLYSVGSAVLAHPAGRRCGWTVPAAYFDEHPPCSCGLCRGDARGRRRRERHEGKRQARDWASA